jgi:hypothetical protein
VVSISLSLGIKLATRDRKRPLKGSSMVVLFLSAGVLTRVDDVVRWRRGSRGLPITLIPRGDETAERILTLRIAFLHSCFPGEGSVGLGACSFSVGDDGRDIDLGGSLEVVFSASDVRRTWPWVSTGWL